MQRTTENFDSAFDSLLRSWTNHQELKTAQAPLTELWQSHCQLADERTRVARAA